MKMKEKERPHEIKEMERVGKAAASKSQSPGYDEDGLGAVAGK